MGNTVKAIADRMHYGRFSVSTDDNWSGVFVAEDVESRFSFVWPYKADGSKASQISVKALRETVTNWPGDWYLEAGTVTNIHVTDLETGKFTVPFGPRGLTRAAARWVRDNVAPFAIEVRDHNGDWALAEWVNGLDNAMERLEVLRADYGVCEYRINKRR